MLRVGSLVDGRYKILRVLGRGGSSCVFLAENIRIHNYWAIKEVYKTGHTGVDGQAGALLAESSILTKLQHPGLPKIVDVMETASAYLIVMEYIEGVSLDKLLQQKGRIEERVVLQWGIQLCDVLQYLHTRTPPIIFRDMKPANIMLKPDGNITLIDFGVAREFKPNRAHDTRSFGTYGYAAPEQFTLSGQTDARTDIYSLGVTLLHLATGQDPCKANSVPQTAALSPRFRQVLQTCMQYEPEKRYASAAALRNALSAVAAPNSITNNANGAQYITKAGQPAKPKAGKNMLWLLTLIPVCFLLLGIVLAVSLSGGADRQEEMLLEVLGEDQYIVMETYNEVDIWVPDQRYVFGLMPESGGTYRFYTDCAAGAPVLWVCDENGEVLAEANTYGEYGNFDVTYELQAGEIYYFNTTLYDLSDELPSTGSYVLYAEYISPTTYHGV